MSKRLGCLIERVSALGEIGNNLELRYVLDIRVGFEA